MNCHECSNPVRDPAAVPMSAARPPAADCQAGSLIECVTAAVKAELVLFRHSANRDGGAALPGAEALGSLTGDA
jgi:hypothetical protein